jgi:hypothetical protein
MLSQLLRQQGVIACPACGSKERYWEWALGNGMLDDDLVAVLRQRQQALESETDAHAQLQQEHAVEEDNDRKARQAEEEERAASRCPQCKDAAMACEQCVEERAREQRQERQQRAKRRHEQADTHEEEDEEQTSEKEEEDATSKRRVKLDSAEEEDEEAHTGHKRPRLEEPRPAGWWCDHSALRAHDLSICKWN